jgi:Flp pilus assembly protein CpaB
MRPNRNMRLGIALMGLAVLFLIIVWIVRARNSNPEPAVVETPATENGATPVSYNPARMSAVALTDLPERSIITRDMFRLEELPEGASPASYVTDLDTNAIGFITRRRILKNERLRPGDLLGHISEVGIAGALSPGTRAMILPLPAKPTFHDLVRIGGYVDVIAAFDGQESRTIVENARVLAVDVFGSDYPQQASVAMRGSYKAPAKNLRAATPATPPAGSTPGTAQPSSGQPAASGQPAPAAPPKEEEKKSDQPPPPPAPSITLEVTPEQANRISLAQNSGAALDFILVPRPLFVAPGATTGATPARVASVTRAQLAPYAESKKTASTAKKAGASSGNNSGGSGGSRGGGTRMVSDVGVFPTPILPEPAPPPSSQSLEPAGVSAPASRPTYEIPIYADGTKVRTDVVLKPKE